MKDETLLQALEEATAQLSIKLSYEDLRKGDVATPGGMFMLRGEKRIIIHRGLILRDRIDVLADLLSELDTESIHLAPEVRARLDRASEKRSIKPAQEA